MTKLFRETPPLDIVISTLRALGFNGITDTKIFSAEEVRLDNLEAWAPMLEPYYLPCKAKRYFTTLDSRRIITLLRHMLPAHGFKLQTYERQHQGKKRTVYQIHPATPHLVAMEQDICVMFL